MIENYNRYRIMMEFFDCPTKKFQLRELSRRTNISLPSVKDHVESLVKENLLKKVNQGTYPGYKANVNRKFKLHKKWDLIRRMEKIGLIEHLKEELSEPNALVLFGSAADGEDVEESDVDILVVCQKKRIDLSKFEEKINRKINLQFISEKDIKKSKEFANNLANGIVLDGYLVVK